MAKKIDSGALGKTHDDLNAKGAKFPGTSVDKVAKQKNPRTGGGPVPGKKPGKPKK